MAQTHSFLPFFLKCFSLIVKAGFRFEATEHNGVVSEMDAIDNTGRYVAVESTFSTHYFLSRGRRISSAFPSVARRGELILNDRIVKQGSFAD